MKKILIVVFLMVAVLAFSQVRTDTAADGTVSLAWDAPADVTAGTVPASEITYELYVAPADDINALTLVTETQDTFFDNIDMTVYGEGKYNFGVLARRDIVDLGIFFSDMHWSHVGGMPSPFTVWYFTRPGMPSGLRVQ
jgi:hypothetical protein